jgi:hypothetical protein
MVLHGYVKKKLNVIFTWEGRGIHNFFVIHQPNGPLPPKNKNDQNIVL